MQIAGTNSGTDKPQVCARLRATCVSIRKRAKLLLLLASRRALYRPGQESEIQIIVWLFWTTANLDHVIAAPGGGGDG